MPEEAADALLGFEGHGLHAMALASVAGGTVPRAVLHYSVKQARLLAFAPFPVTVQAVTTGITLQLATSERLQEAEKELLPHAEPLHTLR